MKCQLNQFKMATQPKVQQATRPNYFKPLQQMTDIPDEKLEEKIELREEAILVSLANHEGWQVLKKYIAQEMERLDLLNAEAIENGASFEDIGKNTVMAQLIKSELQKLINKVEDAEEEQPSTKSR